MPLFASPVGSTSAWGVYQQLASCSTQQPNPEPGLKETQKQSQNSLRVQTESHPIPDSFFSRAKIHHGHYSSPTCCYINFCKQQKKHEWRRFTLGCKIFWLVVLGIKMLIACANCAQSIYQSTTASIVYKPASNKETKPTAWLTKSKPCSVWQQIGLSSGGHVLLHPSWDAWMA